VALCEGGEHGQFAAGLARDLLKAYVDKKTRLGQSLLVAKAPVRVGDGEMGGGGEKPNAPPASVSPSPKSPPQPAAAGEPVAQSTAPGARP